MIGNQRIASTKRATYINNTYINKAKETFNNLHAHKQQIHVVSKLTIYS